MAHDPTPEELTGLVAGMFYWHGIPTLLGCELAQDPRAADIALVGLPWATNPIERTQYLGPRAVRHRSRPYHRAHRPFQVDPFELARIRDFGDVPITHFSGPDEAVLEVERFYSALDAGGCRPFTVGGDHACTLPVLRAIAGPRSRHKGPLAMIHFDSHSDTAPPFGGATCHAGAGFRIAAEEGLIDPRRTVQIGLNGPMVTLDVEAWALEAGMRLLPLAEIQAIGIPAALAEIRRVAGDGPAFISVDLDVLTLSDAPAVANPEAGGLTMNELNEILRGLRGIDVVGGDVVCFVPHLDPSMVTAVHTVAIMHEIVTLMALSLSPSTT